MAKLFIKTRIIWCVCCHATRCTLRKIGEVKMCTECIRKLETYGIAATADGGHLVREGNKISHVPKEVKADGETEQERND